MWFRPTFHIKLVSSKNIDIWPCDGPKRQNLASAPAFLASHFEPSLSNSCLISKIRLLVLRRPDLKVEHLASLVLVQFKEFNVRRPKLGGVATVLAPKGKFGSGTPL